LVEPETERSAGILIPNDDDDQSFIQGLLDAMRHMLSFEVRTKYGQNALVLSEIYTMDRVANDYLKLYNKII